MDLSGGERFHHEVLLAYLELWWFSTFLGMGVLADSHRLYKVATNPLKSVILNDTTARQAFIALYVLDEINAALANLKRTVNKRHFVTHRQTLFRLVARELDHRQ